MCGSLFCLWEDPSQPFDPGRHTSLNWVPGRSIPEYPAAGKVPLPLCQASSASCKCLETPGEESKDGLSHSLVATLFWQGNFTSQIEGLHMCLEHAHTIQATAACPWHWRQEDPEIMMKDIFSPRPPLSITIDKVMYF